MIVGILSFVFSILYWPGIASAATTPRWAFLAVVVSLGLFFVRVRWTLAHFFLAATLGWMLVSWSWAIVGYDGALIGFKFVILSGLFLIGAQLTSLRPVLIGCSWGLLVNSAVIIAQLRGWTALEQAAIPGGLFINKDLSAEFALLVLIGLLYERLWWLVPNVLVSVIMPHSRSVMVAAVVKLGLLLWKKQPRLWVFFGAIVIASGIVYYLLAPDSSASQRIDLWIDTLQGYRWFGHGLGQYYAVYPEFATHVDTLVERPDHAHNDLLEIGYELGIGASLVVCFVWCCWRGTLVAEKAILAAFLVIGCFSFPLYMPATAAIFALVAGRLAGTLPDLRNSLARSREKVDDRLASVQNPGSGLEGDYIS